MYEVIGYKPVLKNGKVVWRAITKDLGPSPSKWLDKEKVSGRPIESAPLTESEKYKIQVRDAK